MKIVRTVEFRLEGMNSSAQDKLDWNTTMGTIAEKLLASVAHATKLSSVDWDETSLSTSTARMDYETYIQQILAPDTLKEIAELLTEDDGELNAGRTDLLQRHQTANDAESPISRIIAKRTDPIYELVGPQSGDLCRFVPPRGHRCDSTLFFSVSSSSQQYIFSATLDEEIYKYRLHCEIKFTGILDHD